MTPEAEPGAAHDRLQDGIEEGFSKTEINGDALQEISRAAEWNSSVDNAPIAIDPELSRPASIEASAYLDPTIPESTIERPRWPRLTPHLGHTLLFFAITIFVLAVSQLLGVLLLEQTHLFGHRSFQAIFRLSADDARLSIPVQAFSYALVAIVVIPSFGLLWREKFSDGVHWGGATARRRFLLLAAAGLACGFGIGAFGSFLPMPKDPPIMQDMMRSPVGAWMMLIFGITAAPLLEELAFRGFLLPGLVNSFRWFGHRRMISDRAVRWLGIPLSIFITSAGFALMHSPQVSHAWGPLVLIGMVSVVLCIVRLTLNSVAAGAVVHAAYNFTLFAGVLFQTGGFRHLDKLTT